MIGAKIGKVWGSTTCLFAHAGVEVHRVRIKAGYQCSRHWHKQRANQFYVISGQLVIHTHKDGLDDKTVLGPGQYTVINPGDRHQFEAVKDTDALEIYWQGDFPPDDIIRETQGGKKNS